VALELAKIGRVRTVTALAPAGLWRRGHGVDGLANRLVGHPERVAGHLAGGQGPPEPGPRGVREEPAHDLGVEAGLPNARPDVQRCAAAPGFRETLRALEKDRFTGGETITVPVTVVFGTRDRVLLPGIARHRDQLPQQTRWVRLRGCGHVPMVDDPTVTADLLLQASDPDTAPDLGVPAR
jgi:pimeloyl-ACP methyl ester carboxylesterase